MSAEKKIYYGTKRVEAWPEKRDGLEGYAILDADGYVSWSTAPTFEAGYKQVDRMGFEVALAALKQDISVRRESWLRGAHLNKQNIAGITLDAADLLAEDWMIYERP